jgi:hypothetical protein
MTAIRRWRQVNLDFKACLSYRMKSCLKHIHKTHTWKKQNKTQRQKYVNHVWVTLTRSSPFVRISQKLLTSMQEGPSQDPFPVDHVSHDMVLRVWEREEWSKSLHEDRKLFRALQAEKWQEKLPQRGFRSWSGDTALWVQQRRWEHKIACFLPTFTTDSIPNSLSPDTKKY